MTVNKYYSITELTREFGVSTRTLRFYEDEGLLHPERRGTDTTVPGGGSTPPPGDPAEAAG
jgi:hypothetical protein